MINTKTSPVENKVRDLINLIAVYNHEDSSEGKKICNESAKALNKGLRELAQMIANLA